MFLFSVPVLVVLTAVCHGKGDRATEVKKLFQSPPRQYSSGPLWVWNDRLSETQIRSTLRDLASQHVKQVWVHPRPGLMTPYLSEEWFDAWRTSLNEAKKLDMNVWIYDENSYPSGFAGGLVPEAMPESRGQGIHFRESKTPPPLSSDIVAVYQKKNDRFINVTEQLKKGGKLPAGTYLTAFRRLAGSSPWFGGKYYVDLLDPKVTQKFLEITMGAYEREIGGSFGVRVPGLFTDEPHLTPAGGIHWSTRMQRDFKKRWGYDIVDHLPSLIRPAGDWKKVRHNFHAFLLEEFIRCWAKPCYEYCEKHDLEFTGHYWEHGWPGASHGGDNMAMYAWHQRPAIDNLMNEYNTGTHAQFGNARTVRELATVANQLGRKRTLCETYGAGGWDLRFEDMKRIGDWLYVLGVNTLNEHLSYITIRGARKRDHPQSFSYHEPWWEAYHVMADYFTRLSLFLSSGKQVHTILVLEPTTTTWMYQPDGSHRNELYRVGNAFQDFINTLEAKQVEYDIGCEDIMARHGSVKSGKLVVGERSYDTVVVTPFTENLNSPTFRLLRHYLASGGEVLCCGKAPELVDGSRDRDCAALSEAQTWKEVDVNELPAVLRKKTRNRFSITRAEDDSGILFHHRRVLEDGEFLFLVNTSITDTSRGTFSSPRASVQKWCPASGDSAPYPYKQTKRGVRGTFSLPPCGSLCLFLGNKAVQPTIEKKRKEIVTRPDGPCTIRRIGPNVLTLDYVTLSIGDAVWENIYFYNANRLVFQKHGLNGNPWDSAVQFRDTLITKTFPEESGFTCSYTFFVEEKVPEKLFVVIERPDLYSITCNGKPVENRAGKWWLDRSFGRIDIHGAASVGKNTVTIKAAPLTMYHELESAYILGSFSLKPAASGFHIVPPEPLGMGGESRGHSTTPDGTMWLSCGIDFENSGPERDDTAPYLVFDLGKAQPVSGITIWNYNEVNLTGRGVKRLKITASETGKKDSFTIDLGAFTLDQAQSGSMGPSALSPRFPQGLSVKGEKVRYVRFDILENHQGVVFPADEKSVDNAFVGLSEVQFSAGGRIGDVKIHEASSELAGNFNRRAQFLLDGSGMNVSGWNRQGCPFYAEGVSYTQTFTLNGASPGRRFVSLPRWYGSVAKVKVNGTMAGYIGFQPWELDVTDLLHKGRNTIEVVVIGTLKNTLGPHHAGAVAGRAWPAMFRRGPGEGPPPGDRYHTIGYGLFQPFVIVTRR